MKLKLVCSGIMISSLLLSGCALKATRTKDTIELSGFGGGEAKFENGDSIKKDSWLPVPDIPLKLDY